MGEVLFSDELKKIPDITNDTAYDEDDMLVNLDDFREERDTEKLEINQSTTVDSDLPKRTEDMDEDPPFTEEELAEAMRESEEMEESGRELLVISKNQLDRIVKKLEMLDELDEQVQYMRAVIDEKLDVDFLAMYRDTLEQMNVEAIKVYRNVQAVIVEENAKQNSALFTIDSKADKLKRRMNHVVIFSIVSFVVSILVMLMQILPALGIHIFG